MMLVLDYKAYKTLSRKVKEEWTLEYSLPWEMIFLVFQEYVIGFERRQELKQ